MSFPPVPLSPLDSVFGCRSPDKSRGRTLFLFINSAYSFYWDVTKDWDLTLLTASRSSPEHPYGLRPHRHFPSDRIYYAAIAIDLLLRFSWLWPLSKHLKWLKYHEFGIFIMVLLEVARRWMWIFFRVEAEWGEFPFLHAHDQKIVLRAWSCVSDLTEFDPLVRNNRGPAPDDILLGDFSRKFDAD